MTDWLRTIGEKLVDIADARTLRRSNERENPFETDLREARMEARYEGFITKAEALISALKTPVVLCGVTIHPEIDSELMKVGVFRMGGKAALLSSRGVERQLVFDVNYPMKSFILRAWGGCVITEVMIGNTSQLISHGGGISEGRFGELEVGRRLSVLIGLPIQEER